MATGAARPLECKVDAEAAVLRELLDLSAQCPMKVSFSLTSMWKRLFSVCDAVFFHTLHRDTQILRFHSDTRLGAIYYNRILLCAQCSYRNRCSVSALQSSFTSLRAHMP